MPDVGEPETEEAAAKIKAEAAAAEIAKYVAEQKGRREADGKVVPIKLDLTQGARVRGIVAYPGKPKSEEAKPKIKDEKSKGNVPDLSLQRRTYDRERPTLEKTIVVLQSLGIHFSYDLFRRRYRVGDYALKEQFGESIDNAILVLRMHITEKLGFDPRSYIEPAVFRLCLENAFNPVLDYLDSLRWDRKPRLDTWLMTYLGATEGVLNRVFGRKVLIAAVRRARKPGTKFDPMLVLEGEQDTGKSSAVKILAGDFFRDEEIISKSNKEAQELTCGVWLYEMSELVGLSKRDVEHVKNFLSRTHDSARGVWGRKLEDQPRTCVFIGTCNRSDYLSDDTGNRRFWPVPTGKIDLPALERDRDQLWAEASMAEAAGEELTIDRELRDEAAMLANSRLADDPWDQILVNVERKIPVDGKFSHEFGEMRASSDWLLRDVLGLNPKDSSGASAKRLGACMRRLGWTGSKTMKINGEDVKGFCKSLQSLYDWR
jgi:hypothetical protein